MSARWDHATPRGHNGAEESGQVMFDIDVMQWVSAAGVNNPGTHVSEPVEITCYSRDENRKITYGGREQLCRFSNPPLQVNLGDRFDSYVPKVSGDVGVEPILRALLKGSFDVDGQADIITYRNNLNKIGTAPYENRDEWELDCVLVGKTIFLDIRQIENARDPSNQLYMYYGYRFESLCTGLSEQPVNANSEFCSISRLRLANHRILLASEIDCTEDHPESNGNPLREYVELKTMKGIDSERALGNMYRHRFLKYWLQSYLGGVRKIVLGIRSESGELLDVKRLKTHEIPREARHHFDETRSRSRWDPFVCINFLDCVLASIRTACSSKPGSTIRVRLDPSTKHIRAVVVAGPDDALSVRISQVWQEFRGGHGVSDADPRRGN